MNISYNEEVLAGGQGLEVVQLLGCRMLRFVKRAGFDVRL
jgi:hypothetical protein